jgi:hypothetical protein
MFEAVRAPDASGRISHGLVLLLALACGAAAANLYYAQPLLHPLGGLDFGCFSALWTSVAFLLAGPPYHYGNALIGLFGLSVAAGAAAATALGLVSWLISEPWMARGRRRPTASRPLIEGAGTDR